MASILEAISSAGIRQTVRNERRAAPNIAEAGTVEVRGRARVSGYDPYLPTIDRAKVRILRFKNLAPFRHHPGLQNHV